MIEMTNAMVMALWRALPSDVQEGREPDDVEAWAEAVLTALERGYIVAVRRCEHCNVGAGTARCCGSHLKWLCHRCYRRTHFVDICVSDCTDCAREGLNPKARPEPATPPQ